MKETRRGFLGKLVLGAAGGFLLVGCGETVPDRPVSVVMAPTPISLLEQGVSAVRLEEAKIVARGIISSNYLERGDISYSGMTENISDKDVAFITHIEFSQETQANVPLVITVEDMYKEGVLTESALRIGMGLSQPEAKAVSYETVAGNGDWRIPANKLSEFARGLLNIDQLEFKPGKQAYLWGEVDSVDFKGSLTIGGKTATGVTGYFDAKGQGEITVNWSSNPPANR